MDHQTTRKAHLPSVIEDDNVSLVHYTSFKTIFCSILIRTLMAVIFMGCGVGALVYAISNSDTQGKTTTPHAHIPGNIYSMDLVTQMSACGKMYYTNRYPIASSNDTQFFNLTEVGSSWYQDSVYKKIRHRIGLSSQDWRQTYYVYEDFSFIDSPTGCIRTSNITYSTYIKSMGLVNVSLLQTDATIANKNKQIKVTQYETIPPPSVLYGNSHPTLVDVYVDPNSHSALLWEMRFLDVNQKNSLYSIRFEFFGMVPDQPDDAIFQDYSKHCKPQSNYIYEN
uniref:Conserved domain protein n=1 Tax=Rhabditophanes sp. KR3021 TaxID=114890 RepID=A0AC35U7A0_9BILA